MAYGNVQGYEVAVGNARWAEVPKTVDPREARTGQVSESDNYHVIVPAGPANGVSETYNAGFLSRRWSRHATGRVGGFSPTRLRKRSWPVRPRG